jgi:DNA polymerase I-like protein with 3'-5' exonuclease and polymerase domains
LFGVPSINIDSTGQLRDALNKLGIPVEDTDKGTLEKYKGHPVIDDLIIYRKLSKLISTYNENLMRKIHPITGKLHTDFKQMVKTGRMASGNPNLQNIPGQQRFRTCFIADSDDEELITDDMSGAELRIMGDMSNEPNFIKAYKEKKDIHTANAANIYKVPYEKVASHQRKASKAVTFGIAYGMSAVGLAARLKIPKDEAQGIIDEYFKSNNRLYAWLEDAKKAAVRDRYSESISGRKKFYSIRGSEDPNRGKIVGAVGRQGMNAPIQGSNADTIKKAMVLCVERLEKLNCGAKLLLTVHDEIIVSTPKKYREEVKKIVSSSLIDGFGYYFKRIPMEADAVIGPCWIKAECEIEIMEDVACGGNEFEFQPDPKFGTKLVCKKCGGTQ